MNPDDITVGIAFVAGLLSFISPCVLPLVPAYIGYMGGRMTNTVATQVSTAVGRNARPPVNSSFSIFLHGVSFVSGFTFVFVAIGLLTTAFIHQISGQSVGMVTDIIGRFGGVLIIFFGIHFMGVLPSIFVWVRKREGAELLPISILFMVIGSVLILWGFSGTITMWDSLAWAGDTAWASALALIWLVMFWLWLFLGGAFTRPEKFWNQSLTTLERLLYADTRRQMIASGQQSYAGSAIMGIVFSAGWTPCIGPVYGAVLTMAANGGDPGRAGVLLAGYSLGLGVPFLLTALLLDGARNILRNMQRHMRKIELVSGAFLIAIGIAVASGELQNLSASFASGQFVQAATDLESAVIERLTGESLENGPTLTEDEASAALTFIETGTVGDSETDVNSPGEALTLPLGSFEDAAEALGGVEVGTNIGDLAPDFEATTDSGETISLSALRGQVVLVNFWATWCGPCRLEMPEFQKTYEARTDEGFTVVAVNNQETVEDVLGFREEYGLTFPLVLDERGEIQDLYGVMMYPSTYVIGRDGVIVARHFGALTAAQLRELVDRAMG